jgi:predicted small metal-binding protein
MAIELSGKDLGVAGCDWSASGETPADVLEQLVDHLRHEHDINLPDAETILEGKAIEDLLMEGADEATELIVRRIYAELDMPSPDSEPDSQPAISQVTGR